MQTPMNKITSLGFLIILFLAAGGGLQCHKCNRVRKDNTCPNRRSCDARPNNFCFIQRISKGGHISVVRKGCTRVCVSVIKLFNDFIKHTFCCRTDFCNKNNIWQLY